MKILTLNINSIRAHAQSFIDILREGKYDTILVQELKVDNANFPHNLFDDFDYNIKVFGQKSWNGVAVFSKHSIEDTIFGLPNYPDVNSRFMECLIGGNIRIINVYMPNGESEDSPKFQYKLEWMQYFTKYIEQFIDSEEAIILAGDFNVAISDIDVWDPKGYVGSSISAPAARDIMQKWLDSGWVDTWRHIHPDKVGFTWYGYRGRDTVGNNQGLRLDYFLTNKTAQNMVKNCEIDLCPRKHEKPTDHCGLVLTI
ncbi:MAG: exodeoxyribonuclease III [Alphaproteobacteria bacterium]|nr:exodeoxyribonuclease III [Alphaproteobacteria bacterium]MBN2675610.1 exodeoxyribonuclease III [Alphaproteobacteria bacterium]